MRNQGIFRAVIVIVMSRDQALVRDLQFAFGERVKALLFSCYWIGELLNCTELYVLQLLGYLH